MGAMTGYTDKKFTEALQFHQQGSLSEAQKIYNEIIQQEPDHPETLYNLAAIYFAGKKNDEAITAYKKVTVLQPDNEKAWNNLGMSLENIGIFVEAKEAYEKAIEINAQYAEVRYNLGRLLQNNGNIEQAEIRYIEALKISPYIEGAYNNLGLIQQTKKDIEAAEQFFKKAIELKAGFTEPYNNLIYMLMVQGKHKEATSYANKLAESHPNNKLLQLKPLSIGPMIVGNVDEINIWRKGLTENLSIADPINLEDYTDELIEDYVIPSFFLNYQKEDNLEIKQKFATSFISSSSAPISKKQEVINVGFFVDDTHEGIFLKVMAGILNGWDSSRVKCTVICTSSAKDLVSSKITNTDISVFEVPSNCNDIIQTIRGEEFDIIYFWEIGSGSLNYFLPFFRLAPVQCTSWGSADTTGVKEVDYFISSKLQEPDNAQENYSEELVLLDNIPAYFSKPHSDIGILKRDHFQFTEDDNLYVVPQSLFKIHPDFDSIMSGILQNDPKAIVVLVNNKYEYPAKLLQKRFSKTIAGMNDRITIVPRQHKEGYFSLIKMADVILDTLYFGGGATTMDALSFGAPIVTLPGTHLRGRTTYACYQMMDINDLIVKDVDEYIELAVKVGTDKNFRNEITEKILSKNDILYENLDSVKELEEFFIKVVKR